MYNKLLFASSGLGNHNTCKTIKATVSVIILQHVPQPCGPDINICGVPLLYEILRQRGFNKHEVRGMIVQRSLGLSRKVALANLTL